MDSNYVLSLQDRHTWVLFEDWCTAHDLTALPATSHTLAAFVSAHPAAATTQRRRIAVLDTLHRRAGHSPPGGSSTIRSALDTTRAALRLNEYARHVGSIITALPGTGWPTALFTRRDALILTLAAAGIPYTRIAALRIGDATAHRDAASDPDGASVHIRTADGRDYTTPPALTVAGVDATLILRRWREVLGHTHHHLSTALLADTLATHDHGDGDVKRLGRGAGGGSSELTGYDRLLGSDDTRPLLTPIDRWGHTPLSPTALTAKAVAGIVHAYSRGAPPAHAPHRQRPRPRYGDSGDEYSPAAADSTPQAHLDPDYHHRGIASRRIAHSALSDVDTILAGVEDRADRLLAELLALIDDNNDESNDEVSGLSE